MEQQSNNFRIRQLIGGIYAPTILIAISQGVMVPVLPLFVKDDLGGGVGLAGAIVGVLAVGTVVADLPGGLLTSRFGGKFTLTLSAFLVAISAIGMAFSRNVEMITFFAFLNGAGFGLWHVANLAYMTEIVPQNFYGRTLSLVGGMMRIGMFIGPFIGALMFSGLLGINFESQSIFILQSIVAFSACILMISQLKNQRSNTATSTRQMLKNLPVVLKEQRSVLTIGGSLAIALMLVRRGRHIMIPLWGDNLGLDITETTLVFGISAAVDMLLFYPVGAVMDRFGRKWTIIPSFIFISLSFLLFPLTGSFLPYLLVSMLSGLGNGLGSGALMTLGADLAPREKIGEFLGIWRLIGDFGSILAPFIVATTAQATSLGIAAVTTGGIGLAAAASMFFLFNETLKKKGPTDDTS